VCHDGVSIGILGIPVKIKVYKEHGDMLQNTCYKPGMPKPALPIKPKKIEPLPMKVSGAVKDELKEIGDEHDRPVGYVARELMLRGLAAYRRDGQLKEPEEPTGLKPPIAGGSRKGRAGASKTGEKAA
jgi:hypothetical protein